MPDDNTPTLEELQAIIDAQTARIDQLIQDNHDKDLKLEVLTQEVDTTNKEQERVQKELDDAKKLNFVLARSTNVQQPDAEDILHGLFGTKRES